MIISKLLFFKIERKASWRDAMMLNQSFLGIAPEAFDAVNIDLPPSKSLSVVYPEMPVSAKHKAVVAFKPVGIDNSSSPDCLHRHIKERSCADILNYFNFHQAISLKDAKDRDLVLSSPSSLTLASTSEVGFISFNFPAKDEHTIIGMRDNTFSDNIECLKRCGIRKPCLHRRFTGRDFQLKELDKPKPLLSRDIEAADPAASEYGEFVSAAGATKAITSDSINLSFVTSVTKNAPIFLTRLFEIFPGTLLRFYDCFKRLYVHATTLSRWQNFYNNLNLCPPTYGGPTGGRLLLSPFKKGQHRFKHNLSSILQHAIIIDVESELAAIQTKGAT